MPPKKKTKTEERTLTKERGKRKYEKGILGVKRRKLFFYDDKHSKWPSSSDSDDSEYNPEEATTSKKASVIQKSKKEKKTRQAKAKGEAKQKDPEQVDDWEQELRKEEPHILRDQTIIDHYQSPWGQSIPTELLTYIFKLASTNYSTVKLLCSVSRVCRLWSHVSANASLWQVVDLSYGYIRSTPDTLRWLCDNRLSAATTSLNLSGWKCLTDSLLQVVVDRCPQLTSVDLSYCTKITAKAISSLAAPERRLTHLALSGIPHTVNKSIKTILADCGQHLKSLLLDKNELRCLHSVIASIADHCSQLQELVISAGLFKFSHRLDVDLLQRGCPQLRVLHMMNCNLTLTNTTVHNETFLGFPELRELNIANIGNSSNEVLLLRLAGKSPHLRLLDVRNCSNMSWSVIESLPATDLQHLFMARTLTRPPDTPTYALLSKWRHSLVNVDVSWNALDEATLNGAIHDLCVTGDFPRLQYVDLSGTGISTAALASLLAHCSSLHTVNLTSCRDLPRGIKHEHAGAAALASLRLLVGVDSSSQSKRKSK